MKGRKNFTVFIEQRKSKTQQKAMQVVNTEKSVRDNMQAIVHYVKPNYEGVLSKVNVDNSFQEYFLQYFAKDIDIENEMLNKEVTEREIGESFKFMNKGSLKLQKMGWH